LKPFLKVYWKYIRTGQRTKKHTIPSTFGCWWAQGRVRNWGWEELIIGLSSEPPISLGQAGGQSSNLGQVDRERLQEVLHRQRRACSSHYKRRKGAARLEPFQPSPCSAWRLAYSSIAYPNPNHLKYVLKAYHYLRHPKEPCMTRQNHADSPRHELSNRMIWTSNFVQLSSTFFITSQ
jgi:hypothetical protein